MAGDKSGTSELRPTTWFKKDLKRVKSRGKDITKLEEIIRKIQTATALDPRNNRHRLSGSFAPKVSYRT